MTKTQEETLRSMARNTSVRQILDVLLDVCREGREFNMKANHQKRAAGWYSLQRRIEYATSTASFENL